MEIGMELEMELEPPEECSGHLLGLGEQQRRAFGIQMSSG